MSDEATSQQVRPEGKGRDVIKLVEEDFIALPLLLPERGLATIYQWSRSITFYLKQLIIAEQGVDQGHIAQQIIADLEDRAQLGEKKYGERLKAFNGRSAKVDAYQESCDQSAYIRQIIEELEIKK